MEYVIENQELKLKVKEIGAEICSLIDKKTNKEYIWSGNPQYWRQQCPILFPFVGRCIDKEYTYQNKTYPMTIHGFANYSKFDFVRNEGDCLELMFKDSKETLEVYPFKFTFSVIFKLDGRKLTVSFKITNNNDGEMIFMFGAHPGFNCPLNEDENRNECFIYFEGKDEVINRGVDAKLGFVNDIYTTYKLDNGFLPIDEHLFDNDALLFENQNFTSMSLTDKNKKPYAKVTMANAPVWAVWSSFGPDTPFVCIEPWFGRCDELNHKVPLEERDFINRLSAKEEFNTFYTIEI